MPKKSYAKLNLTLVNNLKKKIRELRENEKRFKDIVNVSDWIWEIDAKGVYTFANPSVKKILGYDPKEVVGKTPFDFMHSDDKKSIAKYFLNIAKKKESFSNLLNRNTHKNGSVVYLETSGVPIIDEKGKLIGYRGIDRDITERKKAEEKLHQKIRELEKVKNKFKKQSAGNKKRTTN